MKQHEVKTHIEIFSNKKLREQKLLDTTIKQLSDKGCSVAIRHYDENGEVLDSLSLGINKTMVNPTIVSREKVREKRKHEANYDVDKEMQIEMGVLYYRGRRKYDCDGKKGIKVTYKEAAKVILKFFRDVLPVEVNVPCEGEPGGTTTVREPLTGYLRHKKNDRNGKDTAVEDLAKAIARRVNKKGQCVIF